MINLKCYTSNVDPLDTFSCNTLLNKPLSKTQSSIVAWELTGWSAGKRCPFYLILAGHPFFSLIIVLDVAVFWISPLSKGMLSSENIKYDFFSFLLIAILIFFLWVLYSKLLGVYTPVYFCCHLINQYNNEENEEYLQCIVILASTIDIVDEINDFIVSLVSNTNLFIIFYA